MKLRFLQPITILVASVTAEPIQSNCQTNTFGIHIKTNNSIIELKEPRNQFDVSTLVQDLTQRNGNIRQLNTARSKILERRFNIQGILCRPQISGAEQSNGAGNYPGAKVQVLTHGAGFDKSYWDIVAPVNSHRTNALRNSYVEAALESGYATFAYDRLGVGGSDHPDPLQEVQATAEAEILHGIVQGLRAGDIGGSSFKTAVAVSHSLGSLMQLGHDAKYPKDFDAVVFTGISTMTEYASISTVAFNLVIANTLDKPEFKGLSNGYLGFPTPVSFSQPSFRYPYFEPDGKIFSFLNPSLQCVLTTMRSIQPPLFQRSDGHRRRMAHSP